MWGYDANPRPDIFKKKKETLNKYFVGNFLSAHLWETLQNKKIAMKSFLRICQLESTLKL